MNIVTIYFTNILTIILRSSYGARPKLPRCLEVNNVAWKKLPPFTEDVNHNYNDSNGIVEKIFNLGMSSCCFGELTYNHSVLFESQEDVSKLLIETSVKNHFDFLMPIQRDLVSQSYHIYPYVSLVASPGFAVFMVPTKDGGAAVINSIKGVLPFLSVMLLLVGIAGTLYWMLENMTLAWYGEPPERFNTGITNGVWWAFVTMTTVGYGDVVPKTKPGRIFSVLWVFVGLVFCGIVISSITTGIIMSITNNEIEIMNENVAVLRASEEYKFVIKKQGKPFQYDSIEQITEALRNHTVTLALIEVMIAGAHQNLLKNFKLNKIIEHMSGVGIIFINDGSKFAQCVRNFILDRQDEVLTEISKTVKTVKFNSFEGDTVLIDPSIPLFRIGLLCMFGILLGLIFCGLSKEWLVKFYSKRNLINKKQTLMELAASHRQELIATFKDIRSMCEEYKELLDTKII